MKDLANHKAWYINGLKYEFLEGLQMIYASQTQICLI